MNQTSLHILLTMGATIEPIDPVRYLSNWSSGTLGCAVALAAATAGHKVTVLHGALTKTPQKHPRITALSFDSTRDLTAKCKEYWSSQDVLIMAAAVSDFTPVGGAQSKKIRRSEGQKLKLASTDDVVAELAKSKRESQRVIAFSLSPHAELMDIAKSKLRRKSVDAIVANPLKTMKSSDIECFMLTKNGQTLKPRESISKAAFAKWLVAKLPELCSDTPS